MYNQKKNLKKRGKKITHSADESLSDLGAENCLKAGVM
jgi:hypothetical protein